MVVQKVIIVSVHVLYFWFTQVFFWYPLVSFGILRYTRDGTRSSTIYSDILGYSGIHSLHKFKSFLVGGWVVGGPQSDYSVCPRPLRRVFDFSGFLVFRFLGSQVFRFSVFQVLGFQVFRFFGQDGTPGFLDGTGRDAELDKRLI